jgi:anti-anti-sigma factor
VTEAKTLWLTGEVDIAVVDGLRDAWFGLAERGDHELVVVDLGAVTFMDAAGLGLLVGLRTRQQTHGGAVRLADVPPAIVRLLRLTGLLEQFLGSGPDPGQPRSGDGKVINLRDARPAGVTAATGSGVGRLVR